MLNNDPAWADIQDAIASHPTLPPAERARLVRVILDMRCNDDRLVFRPLHIDDAGTQWWEVGVPDAPVRFAQTTKALRALYWLVAERYDVITAADIGVCAKSVDSNLGAAARQALQRSVEEIAEHASPVAAALQKKLKRTGDGIRYKNTSPRQRWITE